MENKMKYMIPFLFLSAGIALRLAGQGDASAAAEASSPAPAQETAAEAPLVQTPVQPGRSAQPEPPAQMPVGDPFTMRGGSGDAGFVSAGTGALPKGIRVKAILQVEGSEPLGALLIPGVKNPFFVREGDVIQIDRPSGVNAASAALTDSQLFLLVRKVTPELIEIAPQTRPQDVRIYR
jgi:hypothetical protein